MYDSDERSANIPDDTLITDALDTDESYLDEASLEQTEENFENSAEELDGGQIEPREEFVSDESYGDERSDDGEDGEDSEEIRRFNHVISLIESGECDLESGMAMLQENAKKGCNLSAFYLDEIYSNKDSELYNPALAFDNYRLSAKYGSSAGCYKTALCLSQGFGCERDEESALRAFSIGATQSNADCIFALGVCYEFGIGCEIDLAEAVSLYAEAAMYEHPAAISNLGGCYFYGHGVEQDKARAIELFASAADLGNSSAQCRLDVCYESGDGCDADTELAFKCYRRAAKAGNPIALYRLALCYDKGLGTEQNFAQSYKYYSRAAASGHAEAMYEAGKMCMAGRGTKKDVTTAYKMFSAATEAGLAKAHFEVGNCFFEGIGTVRNRANAYDHYQNAFEAGGCAADAAFRLGLCKLKGLGTDKNEREAFEWFCRGDELGSVEAMYMKGECLTYGVGTDKDLEAAAEAYLKAVKTEEQISDRVVPAMLSMAICYENGIGIHKNYKKALELYKKASEYGNADAMYRAGRTIMSSADMKTEYSVARVYILRAARKGHLPAMLLMGIFADEGRGIPQNREDAKRWYTKAVNTETATTPPLFDFPERFAENTRLAVESKIEAQYKLGMLIARHSPSTQSYISAYEYIAAAASMGHEGAQTEISKIYVFGGDLKAYYDSHFSREDATFADGDPDPDKETLAAALNRLGDAFFEGKAMLKKNEAAATRCYRMSAELGHIDAAYSYGWCLRHGSGVRENDVEAAKWLKLSADAGNANAAYSYGLCCEEGAGTGIKTRRDALSYYRKAAASGHADAAQRYIMLSERDE